MILKPESWSIEVIQGREYLVCDGLAISFEDVVALLDLYNSKLTDPAVPVDYRASAS